MLCTGCGAELADDARFCNKCGKEMNSATQVVPVTRSSAPVNDAVAFKQQLQVSAHETVDKLREYFEPSRQHYDRYITESNELENLTAPRITGMVVGIIIIIIGIWATIDTKEPVGIIIFSVIAAIPILLYMRKRKKYYSTKEELEHDISALWGNITDYYGKYPEENPYGILECNPTVLDQIKQILTQGRAWTLEDALQRLMDDIRLNNAEAVAQLAVESAQAAQREAGAAMAFSAASLLFK